MVVELHGKPVYRTDVNEMAAERNNANLFVAELTALLRGNPIQERFGKLDTKSLVDALILKREADRLGMPAGPDVAREWIKAGTQSRMTKELFELILARFNNRVSGEQLLSQIGDQIRISNVRTLVGAPVVTPLDVFQTYRDQSERISARAIGFPVEDYLGKVSDPSPAETQNFYDTYKNTLPDPNRPTPGFKIPRQIRVEILWTDGEALARMIKDQLSEAELLSYYENRKSEFKKPSEFPDEIFQGLPDLTPPQVQTFAEVRPYLATSLAEEKMLTELGNKFGRIKDEVMIPFADKYLEAADEIAEAKKLGAVPKVSLPKPDSLKSLAEKDKLEHEVTPLLTRAAADHHGLISGAEAGGLTRLNGGRKFAEELFDTKSALFEPIELTDITGKRFLIRKLEDQPPRIPSLDEVRGELTLAWKTAQARPKARQAADEYAAKVKTAGGKIEGEIAEGHPVITTDAVTKLQPGLPLPGQFFESGPPIPSEIAQLPAAGRALRDAYFGLADGSVAVASDDPEKVYYVLTLNRRTPASFAVLFAPNGDHLRYRSETMADAYKKRDEQWMNELRVRAGLKPDWTPSDEAKKEAESAD